ncbi:MAG: sugar phosphate nucleotidyltransferase [Verrucomicrobiales bacterium]|nr:sugar phosphate nucleotidyltransferase [Verrucomicrobiales bacterium]
MGKISKAFILGAGLGTRLRPLTDDLPKPLVPVFNRPLISYAFSHLRHDLGVGEFAVNTHHCPGAYDAAFPDHREGGSSLLFRHEPVLLDTAGGIDNLRDWLPRDESFIVYNGDILTDLPLAPALEQHLRTGDAVTLILRSRGDELRVGYDAATGKVVDMRGVLLPDWPHRYQFTGIYLVSPEFYPFLAPGKIESVVLPMLEAIRAGARVGGIVIDEGEWGDLGERDAYLDALILPGRGFPRYASAPPERISPFAEIAEGIVIDSLSTVGPGAILEKGVSISESVIWPSARVEAGAELYRTIVRGGRTARGALSGVDC